MNSTPSLFIKLSSARAKKARFYVLMKRFGYVLALVLCVSLFILGLYLWLVKSSYVRLPFGLAILSSMWIIWYKTELRRIPPRLPQSSLDDIIDQKVLANLKNPITPQQLWKSLTGHWEEIFISNRLLLDTEFIQQTLSDKESDLNGVLEIAEKLRSANNEEILRAGTLSSALVLSSPLIMQILMSKNITADDVVECNDWLARIELADSMPKPYFGGIGRDWAFGFTPYLEKFSNNISLQVQSTGSGSQFMSRTDTIDAIINSLDQSNAIAIVGDVGIGKTSAVFALAQRLLQGNAPSSLKDHQIVSLNASLILSQAQDNLERLMLTLFSEAIRAGNMVLFLDEAQLFFQEGRGAFDMSHIILPILQNRRLKLITSFNGTDFQRLKNKNPSLAAALMPVVMQEPSEKDTLKIIQDSSLNIEFQSKKIVTHQAIKEAYRLSGQYNQDAAYPGKAIELLRQSVSYAESNVITDKSVQQTIEKTLGIKAGAATANEAESLLNLEDNIHRRMINQTTAVNAVASALRRARAGVVSTKRPIGSFLFLGPTGVGKTELAKSLAATYFGEEKNMIRLDMSEYQQSSDVGRLLDTGADSDSLILNIRKQPFSVLLLDEIEKAHGSVLNLLLQLLDEGQLTDSNGKVASFRDSIIIVTSNAGSQTILEKVNKGESLDGLEKPLINQLIEQGIFKAELVNRFDEVVLFRPLGKQELRQVAGLMINELNRNLAKQNLVVELSEEAVDMLVEKGYDPQFGARPMRRVVQQTVENTIAKKILSGTAAPGSKIMLSVDDISQPS